MTKEQQQDMAKRIKARRESLGYTQERFSETIELSMSSYTKIENAFQRPSLDTLIRIAKGLGVTLDYLAFGTDGPGEVTDEDRIKLFLAQADRSKLTDARDMLNLLLRLKER